MISCSIVAAPADFIDCLTDIRPDHRQAVRCVLTPDVLQATFDKWWPDLQLSVTETLKTTESNKSRKIARCYIDEEKTYTGVAS
jgi:hypothetical protein